MQISCFDQKIKNNLKNSHDHNTARLSSKSTTFVSLKDQWHHCATSVLFSWLLYRNFVIHRGDWLSIKFCEKNSFRKLFLFFENTFQYLSGISQDISVSHFDSRRSLSLANRRQSTSAMGFPVRTKGTGNTEHMFSQWGLVGTGNREQGTSQSRAKRDAPQGRRRIGKKNLGGESLREQGTGNREQGTCRVPQVFPEHVPEPLRENP